MISKKMQEAINAQINAELWSAYLYLSMSMDAADKGFKGSAHWFVHQFKEEQGHAEKLAGYLQSQNAKVVLAPIAAVQTEWPSVVAMFEDTQAGRRRAGFRNGEHAAMVRQRAGRGGRYGPRYS